MAKNMKRFLIFGVLLALGVSLFAQTASDFEVALTGDGNGVVITKYTGNTTNTIRIPATIEGLPVRAIGEMAFIGEGTAFNSMGIGRTVTPFAVVLPQGLITIGDNAFANSAITSVVIPDSVTEIGSLAFANYEFHTRTGTLKPPNPLLASVTLPKGLTKVGRDAFSGNTALKTVVIPDECSVLGEGMFERCTVLTEIIFPKSITVIPSGAFAWCTGLKTIVFPEGLTEIDGGSSRVGAFTGCTALTSVTLPHTITTIGNDVFRECSALTTVTIPDSVVTIDGGKDVYSAKSFLEWAFSDCGKLNLATQARFRNITVINKAEQERKQREQAARIAEQQQQEQDRARQEQEWEEQARLAQEQERAEWEQLAQEQERAEQERIRIAEEQNRIARERRAQESRDQAAQALAAVEANTKATSILSKLAGFNHRLNRNEFDEFMATCREWRTFAASNKYASEMDSSMKASFDAITQSVLTSAQKKTYNAEFGGR